ncbi:unnamed protein product [Coregonus sp. 'balchen']|nr:unnamed protein product [Coregonus sp. 'balchen']
MPVVPIVVKPGPVDEMVVLKPKLDGTSKSGIRSVLYKGFTVELPDPPSLAIEAAYANFTPDSAPLISTMGISAGKLLVDSVLGKVQAGSVLSYQHPPTVSDTVITHENAPPFTDMPLQGYQLRATDHAYCMC